MTELSPLVSKASINPDEYFNIHTGKPLSSIHPDMTTVNVPNTELVQVRYTEFVTVSSSAVVFIYSNFTKVEAGRILLMSDMVKGCYNLLYNKNNHPHTKKTLEKGLDLTRVNLGRFLKKLLKKGVIYYLTGYKDGKKFTHIMLNPHLAKKRGNLHVDCIAAFQDFTAS